MLPHTREILTVCYSQSSIAKCNKLIYVYYMVCMKKMEFSFLPKILYYNLDVNAHSWNKSMGYVKILYIPNSVWYLYSSRHTSVYYMNLSNTWKILIITYFRTQIFTNLAMSKYFALRYPHLQECHEIALYHAQNPLSWLIGQFNVLCVLGEILLAFDIFEIMAWFPIILKQKSKHEYT